MIKVVPDTSRRGCNRLGFTVIVDRGWADIRVWVNDTVAQDSWRLDLTGGLDRTHIWFQYESDVLLFVLRWS